MALFTYNKFLIPLSPGDTFIKIKDINGVIKYSVDPFAIINTMVSNNVVKINLSNDIILLSFSTQDEAKIALPLLQTQVDYIKTNTVIPSGPTGPAGATGSDGIDGPTGPTGPMESLYDGVDTTDNILAMSPTASLGEVWFSSNEKHNYQAVYLETVGYNIWAPVSIEYNAATDTYVLSTTHDGQTQNVGQEIFFVARNDNGSTASELDPKVFVSGTVIDENPNIKSVTLARASDVDDNSLYGINTTVANLGGITKILTYGDMNDINTSMWEVDDILYINDIRGELTNISPNVNAFPVALVTAVGATAGKLFVNTISAHDVSSNTVEQGNRRFHFTGDETTIGTYSYFILLVNDLGSVTDKHQEVTVGDNEKLGVSQDHLGLSYSSDLTIPVGIYEGQIEYLVDSAQSNEKLYVEVYLADTNGGVTESGSNLPVGDLGISPFLVLETPLLNAASGIVTEASLRGYSPVEVNALVGQRVLFHTLVEKVGTQGGDKTFTLHYGLSHSSYIDGVTVLTTDSVRNNSIHIPGTTLTDALNNVHHSISTDITGLTYSLLTADWGNSLNITGTTSISLSDDLPDGFWCDIVKKGDGLVSITASTIESVGLNISTKYTKARVLHEGSNIWGVYGDLD